MIASMVERASARPGGGRNVEVIVGRPRPVVKRGGHCSRPGYPYFSAKQ
jgi:hypothetical protein